MPLEVKVQGEGVNYQKVVEDGKTAYIGDFVPPLVATSHEGGRGGIVVHKCFSEALWVRREGEVPEGGVPVLDCEGTIYARLSEKDTAACREMSVSVRLI